MPSDTPSRLPEILAPVGSHESFDAALASGADAVYLGLSEGFQARARSTAFDLAGLPALVARAHAAGVKVYLTLNTLVFESELTRLEPLLRAVIAADVDALIVQDPAVALIARELCPALPLHASTQMTISSAEGARFAASLGICRVVLPRELSLREIARFTQSSPLETEVFVHGALCMAWSGQCLTSEAFSQRSANRGQCSQACRMPYDLVIDGEKRELGDTRYLLSPQDLAAAELLPGLTAAGVHSLKIEGRYKNGAYVIAAVDTLRNHREALRTARDADTLARDTLRSRLTYSRGASLGFLRGDDHQTLVQGRTPKHRGIRLGRVLDVRGKQVRIAIGEAPRPAKPAPHKLLATLRADSQTSAGRREPHPTTHAVPSRDAEPIQTLGSEARERIPGREPDVAALRELLRAGMGVMFDVGDPERDDAPGGPIFTVRWEKPGELVLGFGQPGPDLGRVPVGVDVYVTGDPDWQREAERRAGSSELPPRIGLTVSVAGAVGTPLEVQATGRFSGRALHVESRSQSVLAPARGAGLDAALLSDKLAALGGSPFWLEALDTADLASGLHLPVSELKRLRRELTSALTAQLAASVLSVADSAPVVPRLRAQAAAMPLTAPRPDAARIVPLCRTLEQLEAVIASGVSPGDEVELDWMELVGLAKAVALARSSGLKVTIATVRVQKPGEESYDRRIAALAPDAVLVRHWGALVHFADPAAHGGQDAVAPRPGLLVHGDFSLNVTNALTAQHVLSFGLSTLTASHDLDRVQLLALLDAVPRGRVAVTLHHHIPTFHNSHCVYAHLLSDGADYRSCGRPCEEHRVALRDFAGLDHPVIVDVSCRNTVFNGRAQSAAPLVPTLLERGVQRFRVEFVWEQADEVTRTLTAYRALLKSEITAPAAMKRVGVHEQYGVTVLRG